MAATGEEFSRDDGHTGFFALFEVGNLFFSGEEADVTGDF